MFFVLILVVVVLLIVVVLLHFALLFLSVLLLRDRSSFLIFFFFSLALRIFRAVVVVVVVLLVLCLVLASRTHTTAAYHRCRSKQNLGIGLRQLLKSTSTSAATKRRHPSSILLPSNLSPPTERLHTSQLSYSLSALAAAEAARRLRPLPPPLSPVASCSHSRHLHGHVVPSRSLEKQPCVAHTRIVEVHACTHKHSLYTHAHIRPYVKMIIITIVGIELLSLLLSNPVACHAAAAVELCQHSHSTQSANQHQ